MWIDLVLLLLAIAPLTRVTQFLCTESKLTRPHRR
jgi:hypothetical protein